VRGVAPVTSVDGRPLQTATMFDLQRAFETALPRR
jgi:hypothetical protein